MALESFALAGGEFRLRRAVESDIAGIVELLANDPLRAAGESLAPERRAPYLAAFRAIDADPAHLLCVVEDSGAQVVATMQLTILPGLARSGATRLHLEAVRVADELRGKGLGSAMIQWSVAEGRRRGATLVQLTSDGSRVAAHRFYERLGFVQSHAGFKMQLDQDIAADVAST